MAFQFIDGFDHYALADMTAIKWTSRTTESTALGSPGRYGVGQYAAVNSYINRNYFTKGLNSAQTTLIMGAAFNAVNGIVAAQIFGFDLSGSIQCSLHLNSSGALEARRGSDVILGSSASVISLGVWNFLECKVYIHDTAGTFEVRLNGAPVINLTGIDTKALTGVGANTIKLGGYGLTSTYTFRWDDLYVLDTNAGGPIDFLGEVRVETLMPNAIGDSTGFTVTGAANNWEAVDDITPNTTDYVAASAVGTKDLYGIQDLAITPGSIAAVQVTLFASKDDAVDRRVTPVVKSGVTEADGTEAVLASSYQGFSSVFVNDPATGIAWTKPGVDAMQAGMKVTL